MRASWPAPTMPTSNGRGVVGASERAVAGTAEVTPGRYLSRRPAAAGRLVRSSAEGRLAQLGEHQLDKLGVTGSSPVSPICLMSH